MITKEDLKQEIEQLDTNYLELVYRLLQQFPHKQNTQVQAKVNPLDNSRPIGNAEIANSSDLAYTDVTDAAEYGKQLRESAWNRHHQHD